MIEFVQGNLFDAEVDAIVNTVNCVGVMGKGIAFELYSKFAGFCSGCCGEFGNELEFLTVLWRGERGNSAQGERKAD